MGIAPAGILLSQGGRATVPLVANMTNAGGAQLGAYQLQLTFNPAVVRFIGAAPGAFGSPTVNAANAGAGTLLLAGANPAGAGGVVTLANLTFEMLVASGSSPAAISSPQLTAAGTFASVAVTPVSASFCTAAGTYGDVDGDGNIFANDALIVVTAAVGLPIAPYTLTNADVDQNGKVDTRDALFILSYAVSLPTPATRVGQPNAGACGGPAPQTLALQPSPVQLAPGDLIALTPNALDSAGIPTAAHGLAWSSTNPGVATVDTLGIVTAVANGTASVVAMTVSGPADTVVITVADRHTWYVDGAVTTAPGQQLGSSAFPFATIPQALGRAAARDTVRIALAPSPYGPATIAKPVIVLGDSSAAGMPTISSSSGTALSVNTSGRVVLQWLNLDQSNAGLDATGDTLEVQSLSMNALRGIGVRAHGMQRADLRGVRVTSASLAGIWVENTASVAVNGAALSVIAARNDSAAGVAVLNAGLVALTDVTVFGVDRHGPGIVVDSATRATIVNYASNTGSPLAVNRARFAGVAGAVLANGGCGGVATACVPAIHFQADTAVIDTVLLFAPGSGIDLRPHRGSVIPSSATITRSAMTGVQFGDGVRIDSVGNVTITGLTVDTAFYGRAIALTNGDSADVQHVIVGPSGEEIYVDKYGRIKVQFGWIRDNHGPGNGIAIHRTPQVIIDSVIVSRIKQGIGVLVDPAASVSLHHLNIHSAAAGGVWVDSASVVDLLAVSVDSSAEPDFTILNSPVRFAVHVSNADSVHADSLSLHDNAGAGLLVDAATVLQGTGSVVARNLGRGGFGGECGPNGCTCGSSCLIRGQAPLRGAPAYVQFTATSAPGVVLSNVLTSRLARFTVDSNARGGIVLLPYNISAWTFTLDTSFVRGPQALLVADGILDATGQVAVHGSHFWFGSEAIDANTLNQVVVAASTFDSAGQSAAAIKASYVATATFTDDTMREGPSSGIEFLSVGKAQVVNTLIHHRVPYNINNPEAALGFNTTDTITVTDSRIEFNAIRGIRVDGAILGPIVVDHSAITDDSTVGIQVSSPTQVLNSFIARNFVGVDFLAGTDGSQVRFSNVEGNVLAGVRNQGASPVQADNDWWNDPLGPRCPTGCNPASLGDSATGAGGVNPVTPFLISPSPSAPAFAPRLRTSAVRQQVKREGRP